MTRGLLSRIAVYSTVLVALTLCFFFLHYQGKKLPLEVAEHRISQAFKAGNIIAKDYPFKEFGSNSIRTLIGQDQFTECQSFKSMLYPSRGTIREAVILLEQTVSGKRHCRAVHDIVMGEAEPETVRKRTRYWWGWTALYSIAMNKMSIFQVNLGIKALSYFSLMLIAVTAFSHSRRMFYLMCPLLIHGYFFAGIPYFGGVTFSLSFLWSLLALWVLLGLLKSQFSRESINLSFLVFGAISSFLSSFDGHLMLLIPYSMAILYLDSEGRDNVSIGKRLSSCATGLLMFLGGFAGCLLLNQLAKVYYLGWEAVYGNFSKGLSHRLSSEAMGKTVDPVSVVTKLFRRGFRIIGAYRDRDLYQILTHGAFHAGIAAYLIGIYLWIVKKSTQTIQSLVVLSLIISMVFVRILVFLNHSAIHTAFIGRYMFVPLSLSWMMLVFALQKLRDSRSS